MSGCLSVIFTRNYLPLEPPSLRLQYIVYSVGEGPVLSIDGILLRSLYIIMYVCVVDLPRHEARVRAIGFL